MRKWEAKKECWNTKILYKYIFVLENECFLLNNFITRFLWNYQNITTEKRCLNDLVNRCPTIDPVFLSSNTTPHTAVSKNTINLFSYYPQTEVYFSILFTCHCVHPLLQAIFVIHLRFYYIVPSILLIALLQ